MSKRTYVLDGGRLASPPAAGDAVTRLLELSLPWDGAPETLPELLNGGYGTPHDGFILVWKNSRRSREALSPEHFDRLVEIFQTHGVELRLE